MAEHTQDKGKQLKCSFCGRAQDEVHKLIQGPNVYICDECINKHKSTNND